jgi:hypothetical protein
VHLPCPQAQLVSTSIAVLQDLHTASSLSLPGSPGSMPISRPHHASHAAAGGKRRRQSNLSPSSWTLPRVAVTDRLLRFRRDCYLIARITLVEGQLAASTDHQQMQRHNVSVTAICPPTSTTASDRDIYALRHMCCSYRGSLVSLMGTTRPQHSTHHRRTILCASDVTCKTCSTTALLYASSPSRITLPSTHVEGKTPAQWASIQTSRSPLTFGQ